jgi:hypothetical protein
MFGGTQSAPGTQMHPIILANEGRVTVMNVQHLTSLAQKAHPNVQTFQRSHVQTFASSSLPSFRQPALSSSKGSNASTLNRLHLILEKTKIQRTIEEQIPLPPYMSIFR